MESNFLQFTYLLGVLGLYFGFLGFSKVSGKVFSNFVYQQIQKPYRNYISSGVVGVVCNFLFGRMHRVQGFVQGAMYLEQLQWKKALSLLLGAGLSTAIYFFVIAQMLKFQWLFASVIVSIFGLVAIFVFRSDLYRLHGQRLFYLGIMFLGFAWMNNVHQVWSEDMLIEGVWFWINQNLFWVFIVSVALSVFLQTSFIAGVIALSLLHLDMITFEASLSMFFGGYVGSPIGSLLVYAKAQKDGFLLQVIHASLRFIVTGLSLVWIHPLSQSPLLIALHPTELLVLMFLLMQVILICLYWPFHEKLFQALSDSILATIPTRLDPYRLFANQPTLCFEVAQSYVLEMADRVRKMMEMLCDPFEEKSRDALIRIDEQYDQVEQMARQINFYLSKINLEELSYLESQRETHWFQISHALKNISSFINRNIMDIAGQIKERGVEFDPESWERVQECHTMLVENFDRMVSNVRDEDPDKLKTILRNQKQIHSLKEEIKQSYLQKVRADKKISIEGAAAFLSLLSQLQFLNISISRLAYPTIDRRKNR